MLLEFLQTQTTTADFFAAMILIICILLGLSTYWWLKDKYTV